MLTVGIIEYAAFASNAAEETSKWKTATEEARESAEKLTEGIDDLKKSRDEQITSAEGEAALLRTLQEEYNELTSITNRNAEQNERLEYIASRLAEKLNITTNNLKDQSGAYHDLNRQIEDCTLLVFESLTACAAYHYTFAIIIYIHKKKGY